MNIEKIEIWVHDHILKNSFIRHFLYGAYQRVLWLTSPKFKFEGNIECCTPDDGYEYLFGYYDKCPWSPDEKFILALRVKDAHKKADSDETGDIVTIEAEKHTVNVVAKTNCWNVQQGCMMQWLTNSTIIYNDFRNEQYCCIVLNIITREEKIIGMPIYALSPDKVTALSLDFSRLHRLRPGYGYCNIPERTKNDKCPDDTCIWKINIETGDIKPLLKYTDFSNFEPRPEMIGAEHKVNHIMINPEGTRFMILHRWIKKDKKYTRLVTCSIDGSDFFNLSDDDFVSHCCWKNSEEILSYLNKKDSGKGYYLLRDKTDTYCRVCPELIMDGHPSYSPDGNYVITDSYPDRRRIQSLYIMGNSCLYKLARVFSPFRYSGNTRCDLHPRWSRSGNQVCFDASFNGKRNICIANVSKGNNVSLISIIIPVYNAASSIDSCIKSLLSQTDNGWEAIFVDDGSEDESARIIKKYSEIDNRIRYIFQENQGPGAARNTGLERALGEYVGFLDADDYLSSEYISTIKEQISLNGSDVIFFNAVYERQDFSVIRKTRLERYSPLNINRIVCSQIAGNFPWSACFKVIRREIIEENSCCFTDCSVGEEAIFSLDVMLNAKSVSIIPKIFYHYIDNQNGQHTKAQDDPWHNVIINVRNHLKEKELLNEYYIATNCLMYKALSISLFRIAKNNGFFKSINKMHKKIRAYKNEFSFGKINSQYVDKKTYFLSYFMRMKFCIPIYIAAKLRKK